MHRALRIVTIACSLASAAMVSSLTSAQTARSGQMVCVVALFHGMDSKIGHFYTTEQMPQDEVLSARFKKVFEQFREGSWDTIECRPATDNDPKPGTVTSAYSNKVWYNKSVNELNPNWRTSAPAANKEAPFKGGIVVGGTPIKRETPEELSRRRFNELLAKANAETPEERTRKRVAELLAEANAQQGEAEKKTPCGGKGQRNCKATQQ